jgi:hypothetical protein
MFEADKPRYLTCGVDAKIPLSLQVFLWQCVEEMPEPKDYLQVFKLSSVNGLQVITHYAEQPEYEMQYVLTTVENPVTSKVYVIDDGSYCTMLLAEEY